MGSPGMTGASKKLKRICVITGTRAEFGLLEPVMREIQKSGLELKVLVAGMHLCKEFGFTYRMVEEQGFKIDAKVEMTPVEDTHEAMTRSIGLGILGMTQAIENMDPDGVMVLGDRVEAFSGAVSAGGLNRVVAHIHGGDVSKGGLDDSMRHAITKFAHIHFTATEKSRERVIRMGEDPGRVFTVGAPGLDSVLKATRISRDQLGEKFGFSFEQPVILAVQHSVSTHPGEASGQMRETLEALKALGYQTVLIYPNADAGGRSMIEVIEEYRGETWLRIHQNLEHKYFISLMAEARAMVGNSSSGIIEAPSLKIPVVNIGERQKGRERSTNVQDVPPEKKMIIKALKKAIVDTDYVKTVRKCVNPYGDGKAGERIVNILGDIEITRDFTQKQLTY